MRQHKYSAWLVHEQRMVHDIQWIEHAGIIINKGGVRLAEGIQIFDFIGDVFLNREHAQCGDIPYFHRDMVKLLEWTGFKDVDGKPIIEGSIIKKNYEEGWATEKNTLRVCYIDGILGYKPLLLPDEKDYTKTGSLGDALSQSEYRVVGHELTHPRYLLDILGWCYDIRECESGDGKYEAFSRIDGGYIGCAKEALEYMRNGIRDFRKVTSSDTTCSLAWDKHALAWVAWPIGGGVGQCQYFHLRKHYMDDWTVEEAKQKAIEYANSVS